MNPALVEQERNLNNAMRSRLKTTKDYGKASNPKLESSNDNLASSLLAPYDWNFKGLLKPYLL